ncbi:clustered mitochondria protein homolog [Boleophthalmus pectinirostris]|uniref:clustered mitochondria protein homolog n=1 Tax=Boleophthalmus pectinirostris TaxID=150288 RepID=UPI002432707A|nr:clustered mitochondria protein homolog [Boleophthalmus pectinirostris]
MGNVQCCHFLSNYFKCPDALAPSAAERSPLLSSDEETRSNSPSLHDDTEDDLLTMSTDLTNPTLEPEHFLFPDLILSSKLGVDAAVVEPMVCLLVSEEEEGQGAERREDTTCRRRLYSEVETQTENETQILKSGQIHMHVEVETQTERLLKSPKKQEKEKLTEIKLDIFGNCLKEHTDITKHFEDAADSVKIDIQAKSDKQNMNIIDTQEEMVSSCRNKDFPTKLSKNSIEHNTQKIQNNMVLIVEQSELFVEEKDNIVVESNSEVKCEKLDCYDEEVLDTVVINSECVGNILVMEDTQETLASHDQKEEYTFSKVDTSTENRIQKEYEDSDVPFVMDLDTALHAENLSLSGTKQMTLFLVDKLFLETPQFKAPPCQTEEEWSEEMIEQKIEEIVAQQEMNFTVKIQPPGADIFRNTGMLTNVSGQMLVAELHQVLMDHELTCHRTCFSLQLGSAVLDSLSELQSIQGLQEGEVIKVVEAPYAVRDARLHLRHVKNLLRSLDHTEAYNGQKGCSISFVNLITQMDKDGESRDQERFCMPPEYVLPGCKDRPLAPLLPHRDDLKPLQCLQVLTLSSWNPPPGNRKMHGDLLYLNVLTIENREFNITASTRGFYINQSTAFNFNPKPASPTILCHSLVELLSQISPAFKKNFTALQKKRVQQHPYERIPTLFQTYVWIAPLADHSLDGIRAEETHSSHMGQDDLTAGQNRDWNEELQGSRELSKNTLQDRILREKSIFKTSADFTVAATRGAEFVVDGNAVPLNPGEAPHLQMFIWNNMFFSLGFDVSEHFRPLGGDTAAHAAALRDLRGTQAYTSLDINGLHTLGTAVIDYRGVRVIAQSIVPGLLEKTQEQPLVYGSNDYGKTVYTHPRFVELLDKTCHSLKIQRHTVLDHSGTPVDLCSGVETKGIFGNDGRAYILDLLRAFPPDLNFQLTETEHKDNEEIPKECVQYGYPRQCRHRLASHRPELVEAFVQHRYDIYAKAVSKGLTETDNCGKKQEVVKELTNCRENNNSALNVEDVLKQAVILEACRSVGSVSDSSFDIRFNPDVCSPDVTFPVECAEEFLRQRQLLWHVAAFLLSHQIPALLTECLAHPTVVMDGATLTSELHRHGINVRYLGTVLEQLDSMEECVRLSHVKRICVSEVIVRSTKHTFRTYLQDVDPASLSAAVSHFLNCFLGSSCFVPGGRSEEMVTKRRSRRRRRRLSGSVWAKLTHIDLWSRIKKEAQEYFGYHIESGSMDEVTEKHSLQKISLLRAICLQTGIQVLLKEYVFESRHRPVFTEEDVMNMFPVIKHLNPTSSDASRLIREAQRAVQRGLLKDGYDLISQAISLFTSVCGVLHEDVCSCLRLQGRLSYILGQHTEAINLQEKTATSSERIKGVDHPQTIQDYTYLALYCFAGGQHATSLQLLYRARYLSLLVCGEDHPQVALIDSMLGLVLHGLMEYELSQKFLENVLCLAVKYYGAMSLKHAQSHHQLATLLESKGDFRAALHHEKEACSIYQSQVGEDHDRTRESKNYLKTLTQQAVNLQKALNQIYCETPCACITPPKLSVPNTATILQQLNLTCGIVLVPLSAEEVTNLGTKIKKEETHKVKKQENIN